MFSRLIHIREDFFLHGSLRLWEFLIGYGAAALGVLISIPLMPLNGTGGGLIFAHPGVFAFIVSAATAAILVFGLPASIEFSKPGTALERLGKYSYSIYLAHFPVIVFYYYEPFSGTILGNDSATDTLAVIRIIFLFSLALYYLVENRAKSFTVGKAVPAAGIVTLLFSFIAYSSTSIKYSEEEMYVFSALKDRGSYRCGRLQRVIFIKNTYQQQSGITWCKERASHPKPCVTTLRITAHSSMA